jgi:hypothetical protein
MENYKFKDTYDKPLQAGTEHRVWWLYSKNLRTVRKGKHYLVSWLVDRETGDVVTGKYEVTLAPHVWFSYVPADMAAVARAQKSTCTCSTNHLQYSEQHLSRLGFVPSNTLAQEVPFVTCASGKNPINPSWWTSSTKVVQGNKVPDPLCTSVPDATSCSMLFTFCEQVQLVRTNCPNTCNNCTTIDDTVHTIGSFQMAASAKSKRDGCFAAGPEVGRPQTTFEWAGLFTFDEIGDYEWTFRSNGGPLQKFSYPDAAIGVYIAKANTLEGVHADAQSALGDASNSSVVPPNGMISLIEPRRQSLTFDKKATSTTFHLSVVVGGETYAIFTEHMPWEFTATHMVGPMTTDGSVQPAVFPSNALEFALSPDRRIKDAEGRPLTACLKMNSYKVCRAETNVNRCNWMSQERQCTACNGCNCHSYKTCKSHPGECVWWDKTVSVAYLPGDFR